MDDQVDVVLCLDGLSSVKVKAFQNGKTLSGFSTTISGQLRSLLKQVYSSESLEKGILNYLNARGTCVLRIEYKRQFFKAQWVPDKVMTAMPQLAYSPSENTVQSSYYAQGLGDIQDAIRLGETLFFDKWRGELLQMQAPESWPHQQWRLPVFLEAPIWDYASAVSEFPFVLRVLAPVAVEGEAPAAPAQALALPVLDAEKIPSGTVIVNLRRQKESTSLDFFLSHDVQRLSVQMDRCLVQNEDEVWENKILFLPLPAKGEWDVLSVPTDMLMTCFRLCEAIDPRVGVTATGLEFSRGISPESERELLARLEELDVVVQIHDMPATVEDWKVTLDMRGLETPEIRVFRGRISVEDALWEEAIRQDGQVIDSHRLILLREEARVALAALARWRQLKEKTAKGHIWHPLLQWVYLRQNGVEVLLSPEQQDVLTKLMQFSEIPEVTIPDYFAATLRAYQHDAVRWLHFLYGLRMGACLADDMGLGKTVQTLAFLSVIRETNPTANVMIVVPPSLVHHWVAEWKKFLPGVPIAAVTGKNDLDGHLACVTSYEAVRRQATSFGKRHWQVVVFDEAHWVKNPTAQRADAVRRIVSDFRLCLTGTPLENHLGEFVAVMETAVPGLFFGGNISKSGMEQDWVRGAKPFLLRRTKTQMLPELPEKIESDVVLEMDKDQQDAYDAIRVEARQKIVDAYASLAKNKAGVVALTALLRLRQICVSPELVYSKAYSSVKFDYLMSQLETVLDEGHSCLVFSQFRQSLVLLEKKMKAAGIPNTRIDGTTPGAQRQTIVDAFQNSETPQVLLMSLKTGGVGFHLTRASVVFHLDPWWNPAVEDQATDRTYRLGQNKAVNVYRLLIKDSIEERIQILKKQKQQVFASVVGSGGMDKVSSLTCDDFMFVLGD